jgi:hypothetical protein
LDRKNKQQEEKTSIGIQQSAILEISISRITKIHKFIHASFDPDKYIEANKIIADHHLCEQDVSII